MAVRSGAVNLSSQQSTFHKNVAGLMNAGIHIALGFKSEDVDGFMANLPGPLPGDKVLVIPGKNRNQMREIARRFGIIVTEQALDSLERARFLEPHWLPRMTIENRRTSVVDRLKTANVGVLAGLYLPFAVRMGAIEISPDLNGKSIEILPAVERGGVRAYQDKPIRKRGRTLGVRLKPIRGNDRVMAFQPELSAGKIGGQLFMHNVGGKHFLCT